MFKYSIFFVVSLFGTFVSAGEFTQATIEDLKHRNWHQTLTSTISVNQNYLDSNFKSNLTSSSSSNLFRIFTRGIEKPLTEKEDISAKFRFKPNGESSVSITFKFN